MKWLGETMGIYQYKAEPVIVFKMVDGQVSLVVNILGIIVPGENCACEALFGVLKE